MPAPSPAPVEQSTDRIGQPDPRPAGPHRLRTGRRVHVLGLGVGVVLVVIAVLGSRHRGPAQAVRTPPRTPTQTAPNDVSGEGAGPPIWMPAACGLPPYVRHP